MNLHWPYLEWNRSMFNNVQDSCCVLIGGVRCWSALFGADRRCSVLIGGVRCWSALFGADRRCSVLIGADRLWSTVRNVRNLRNVDPCVSRNQWNQLIDYTSPSWSTLPWGYDGLPHRRGWPALLWHRYGPIHRRTGQHCHEAALGHLVTEADQHYFEAFTGVYLHYSTAVLLQLNN